MNIVDKIEIRLLVDALSESEEDFLADELDAHIAVHGSQTFATFLLTGELQESWPNLLAAMQARGISAHSMVQDLVTTTEIADRLGVSRQAVNNWIRGTRKAEKTFPEPSVISGVSLWDWGKVATWARSNSEYGEMVRYPSQDEIAIINGRLAEERLSQSGWITARIGLDMDIESGHIRVAVRDDDVTRRDHADHEDPSYFAVTA